MKNKLLILTLLFLQSAAFAIDQVTLTSGEVLQGKVLSDAPHQHVDIQLVNGTKRRIPHDQVTNVERDVPSNRDYNLMGSTSQGYLGALLGVEDNLTTSKTALFTFGVRGGANFTQMGDFAALAFGLFYGYTKDSTDSTWGAGGSLTTHDIMLQMLFRRVSNSGFYFGPELGLAMNSVTSSLFASNFRSTAFQLGALAGYDLYLSDGFSIGGEFKYDHQMESSSGGLKLAGTNRLKFLVSGTIHF